VRLRATRLKQVVCRVLKLNADIVRDEQRHELLAVDATAEYCERVLSFVNLP
jgi:hypothetical protein